MSNRDDGLNIQQKPFTYRSPLQQKLSRTTPSLLLPFLSLRITCTRIHNFVTSCTILIYSTSACNYSSIFIQPFDGGCPEKICSGGACVCVCVCVRAFISWKALENAAVLPLFYGRLTQRKVYRPRRRATLVMVSNVVLRSLSLSPSTPSLSLSLSRNAKAFAPAIEYFMIG